MLGAYLLFSHPYLLVFPNQHFLSSFFSPSPLLFLICFLCSSSILLFVPSSTLRLFSSSLSLLSSAPKLLPSSPTVSDRLSPSPSFSYSPPCHYFSSPLFHSIYNVYLAQKVTSFVLNIYSQVRRKKVSCKLSK